MIEPTLRSLRSLDQRVSRVGTISLFVLKYDKMVSPALRRAHVKMLREGLSLGTKTTGIITLDSNASLNVEEPTVNPQVLTQRDRIVSRICSLYGVPPSIVLGTGEAKYSNLSESHRQFVSTTLETVAYRLRWWLERGLGMPVGYDFKRTQRGDRKQDLEASERMAQIGVFTASEIRAAVGYSTEPRGEYYQSTMPRASEREWTSEFGRIRNDSDT